jgi:hypothetical protein
VIGAIAQSKEEIASSLFGMGSNDRCEHSSEVSWFGDGRFSAPA